MRWFDLKSLDGKLERVRESEGHHALILEIAAERAESVEPATVERLGWIGSGRDGDRLVFRNYRSILRATDVAQCLHAFYSEADIRDSYTEQDRLGQGERVEGLRTRATAQLSDFEEEMQGVAPEDLQRIRRAIVSAGEKVRDLDAKSSMQPLDGRGLEFIQAMDSAGEALLGVAAVKAAVGGNARRNLVLEQLIAEIVEGNAADSAKVARLREIVPDYTVTTVDAARQHLEENLGTLSTAPVKPVRLLLAALRSDVPVRALQEEAAPEVEVERIERRLGLQVRRDNSLPSAQYAATMASVERALGAVADALNRDIENIVPRQNDVVLRISRRSAVTSENVSGRLSAVGSADDEIGAVMGINIAAYGGGAFIHEVGHLVDRGYGISAEERREVLEVSGIRGRVNRALQHDVEEGNVDPSYAKYAGSDEEIWARTFEAALVNRAMRNGDLSLRQLGGLNMAFPVDHHSPVGDVELTEKFLREVNELIEQKLQAVHAKRPPESAATVEP